MKTYVLDVINRIKRFSEKFNVSTTLCDKTWLVFNDSGEKEVYIFQPDGTAFITTNGVGIKGQWHWVSANQSLVINNDGKVIMLHPEYIDNTILALKLDGTNKMAFLIEENLLKAFPAKTLAQLEQYFIRKEKYLIEKDKLKVEWNRLQSIETVIEGAERRINEHYKWIKDNEEKFKKEAKKLRKELESNMWVILTSTVFYPILILLTQFAADKTTLTHEGAFIFSFIIFIVLSIIAIIIDTKRSKKRIKKWKDENPNDPRKIYLDS